MLRFLSIVAATVLLLSPASSSAGTSSTVDLAPLPAAATESAPPKWNLRLPPIFPSPQIIIPAGGGPVQIFPGYAYRFDDLDPLFMRQWHIGAPFSRAVLESATLISMNMAIYWASPTWNSADWELSWDAKSWRQKLVTFTGVLLDNNNFNTNAVSHPVVGSFYYMAGRSNRLPIWQSFALSFGASAFWEYVSEYKERVSFNDLIMTPGGGAAIGESLYQMSAFFGRGAPTALNEALSLVFSPFVPLNKDLDPSLRPKPAPVDKLGFPTDVYHQFEVAAGGGVAEMADGSLRSQGEVALKTEIINLREYGRPERARRFVKDGSFSRLDGRVSFAAGPLYDVDILAKAAILGYFAQDADSSASTVHSVFVGASTAFDFDVHQWYSHYSDKIAMVNLPGPTIDVSVRRGALKLRASLDINGDFGMVTTPALDPYLRRNGDKGMKSVLSSKKYYFATGITVRPRVSAEYRGFEVAAESTIDYFHSIQGLDRFQKDVTNDFELDDQRASHAVSLRYRAPYLFGGAPPTRGFAEVPWVRVERLERAGSIGDIEEPLTETRLHAGISLVF